MTEDDRMPLEALARRLAHARAVAVLIAKSDDHLLGEAVRGVATMIDDAGDQLDAVLGPMRRAAGVAE